MCVCVSVSIGGYPFGSLCFGGDDRLDQLFAAADHGALCQPVGLLLAVPCVQVANLGIHKVPSHCFADLRPDAICKALGLWHAPVADGDHWVALTKLAARCRDGEVVCAGV